MKLYIELQDYEELKDIVKRRDSKNLYKLFDIVLVSVLIIAFFSLLLGLCLLFVSTSIKYPVIAFISSILFFLLGIIMDIRHNNCKLALEESLLIEDLKFPIEILNYRTSSNSDNVSNQFYFDYFDDNDILQSRRFYIDKTYIHKKDYYKIVGQFDENRKNYKFYLYKPFKIMS